MSQPLVSVAIATCNGQRYLREQLATVYAQSWTNLEVVVSDDASTDGTVEILEEHARSHGLHYVVQPRNLGLVQNFARAISLCRGELVALCDQDDLWKPDKIERLARAIGDATLIYCNCQEYVDEEGRAGIDLSSANVADFARACGTGRPSRHLLAENWVVSHTLMFRRELIRHALPIPPHQVYHDGWLALVAAKLGGIRYLDERLQTYRRHPASMTFPDPARHRRAGLLAAFGPGYRAAWRGRCRIELARLGDARGLALLDAEDRAVLEELLLFYRAGAEGRNRWRALRNGWKLAPYFSSQYGRARWRLPLRAFLGSLGGTAACD
jgi:glycosyltransferase involved in cell wall biosynthesis